MLQSAADFGHAADYGRRGHDSPPATRLSPPFFGVTMLYILLILLGLLLAVGLWARPLTKVAQQRMPNSAIETEQVLLWGGLFLSALSLGLLVLYLFLQP